MPLMTYYVRGHRPAAGWKYITHDQSQVRSVKDGLCLYQPHHHSKSFKNIDNGFMLLTQENDFVTVFFFFVYLFCFCLFFLLLLFKNMGNALHCFLHHVLYMIAAMLVDDVI